MTDKEIIEQTNQLARQFYRMMGYRVFDNYRFDKATHPQERLCWDMAVEAQEILVGTDVINILAEHEE